MKSHIGRASLGMVLVLVTLAVLAVLSSACGSAPELGGNQPPVISSLEAKYINVDPRAASGGSLSGAGSIVTWEAPNNYGDYHIMVIVKDDNGGSTQGTLTLSVVARPSPRGCCGQ